MKIYIISSDQYAFLLGAHVELINKYYPDQDITILAYDLSRVPKINYDNVKIVSLGTQIRAWTDPIKKYFETDLTDNFIVAMDDLILIKPVDREKISTLEKYVISGEAKKAVLGNWLFNRSSLWEKDNRFLRVDNDATYRMTLHPAIWNREYFLRYLKPGFTAWDFELRNYKESSTDNETIISYKEDVFENHVYDAANIFWKGGLAPGKHGLDWAAPEDKKEILELLQKNT